MQEAFDKLKGVDIFSLKSYMEPTGFGSFNGVWVMMNEICVNFFFFILNAVVGSFSLLIHLLEQVDLYNTYKIYVFHGANTIWKGFTGSTSNGLIQNSLVHMALLGLAFYLFFEYFFSKGNFSRKLLHVSLVILLGFGYFGTVSGTSGGLYLLDTINNISKTVSSKISDISINYGENQKIKVGESLSDSYISETTYKAYLFVNTGQDNGNYKNSQDGKEEEFDDKKVLGEVKDGKFEAIKSKDRQNYLDEIGDGANDDGEKNRWVSAIPDFIFIRMFYLICKIIEALVLAIPIVLVQLLNVLSQLLVLMMILLFPIVLLLSFLPRMQELLFGIFKVMLGGLAFPAITSLLTLLIFYIEKVLEGYLTTNFDTIIKSMPSLILFGIVFKLFLSVVVKALIFFLLWKYKAPLMQLLLGSRARLMTTDIGNKVENTLQKTKELSVQLPDRSLSMAQNLGNFSLATTGFGAGIVGNTKEHFKQAKNFFKPQTLPSMENETSLNQLIPEFHDLQSKQAVDLPSEPVEGNLKTEKPISPEQEFQTLKQGWVSPFNQWRIQSLEKRLDAYKEPSSMYKAQGSNSFTKNYRKTMTRDQKIRANIERKKRLQEKLNELRGEQP